jgi:hypothetical protein
VRPGQGREDRSGEVQSARKEDVYLAPTTCSTRRRLPESGRFRPGGRRHRQMRGLFRSGTVRGGYRLGGSADMFNLNMEHAIGVHMQKRERELELAGMASRLGSRAGELRAQESTG